MEYFSSAKLRNGLAGLRPGARFSKVPRTFRARKAIRKTKTCLFSKAGLFICCKVNKNTNNCKVSCLETPSFWRYKENYVTRKTPEKFRDFRETGPCFSNVPKLLGPVWGATIPFIYLQRRDSKPSNFAVLFVLKLVERSAFKTGGLHFDNWLFGPEKFLELSRNREAGLKPCSGAVTSLVSSCSHCSAQRTSFICGAGRSNPKVYPYKACLVTTEEATWPCGYEAGLKIPNSSSALTMPPGGLVLVGSLWPAGSLVISSQLVVSGSTPRLHLNIVCP